MRPKISRSLAGARRAAKQRAAANLDGLDQPDGGDEDRRADRPSNRSKRPRRQTPRTESPPKTSDDRANRTGPKPTGEVAVPIGLAVGLPPRTVGDENHGATADHCPAGDR